ncbi:hypothetical protein WG66_004240 [Moniliophthora roreri]|nr:hypothetical protein WG66_004240 [Moniliophthora roreri]
MIGCFRGRLGQRIDRLGLSAINAWRSHEQTFFSSTITPPSGSSPDSSPRKVQVKPRLEFKNASQSKETDSDILHIGAAYNKNHTRSSEILLPGSTRSYFPLFTCKPRARFCAGAAGASLYWSKDVLVIPTEHTESIEHGHVGGA